MPLRAIIDGKDVLSPFLDDDEWDALKRRIKTDNLIVCLPCCGNSAYLRTSKRKLKHFVHQRRGDCTSASEAWQHVKAKHDIVIACRNSGYNVSTEVVEEGWRADVLATKGEKIKIAFEVRWSRQNLETTLERQAKYTNAGIRGCWFFKSMPVDEWHSTRHDVPMFSLQVDEKSATVNLNDKIYPLTTFAETLLTQGIRYCENITSRYKQSLRIVFMEMSCYRCQKPFHVYYMHNLQTDCGFTIDGDAMWGDEKIQFHPQVLAVINAFITSGEGQHIRLGPITKRYSRTVGHKYMSFGCPHCDAICGDWFIMEEKLEMVYHEEMAPAILEKDVNLSERFSASHPHWCFPENGEFCCDRSV